MFSSMGLSANSLPKAAQNRISPFQLITFVFDILIIRIVKIIEKIID